MKILYAISDKNIGGAGVLLCNILRHLDRRRFQSVVALPFGSALRERLLELHVPVREMHNPCDRFSCASVWELTKIIREESPDIVHANAALCARIAGKLCGKRVVHTRHCCFPVKESNSPIVRSAERMANRMLSDCVIATADAAAVNLMQMGIPRSSIRVILNGSDPVRKVGEDELSEWRKRLDLKPEDFCVGICARLEPYKGHETFLEAAATVQQSMPHKHFRFLIVGDGSRRKALEQLAAQKGLSGAARFTGFIQDMAPIYRLLRINVNCSSGTETSCLAISEGMSACLPTVASNYGGNIAMLGTDGAGICFPVGDANALAGAICSIASKPELEQKMRLAAGRRYAACYTATGMTQKLSRVYTALL